MLEKLFNRSKMWTKKVLLGVVDEHIVLEKNRPDPQQGLACDPGRVLTERCPWKLRRIRL